MRNKLLLKRSKDVANNKILKISERPVILFMAKDKEKYASVESQIKNLGFDVIFCDNYKEAVASAKYWKPSIIISELSTKNIKGVELFKLLKEDARTNVIPFLFIVDEEMNPDQLLGFQLGANDYIIYPFHPNEFKTRLLTLIKRGKTEFKNHNISENENNKENAQKQGNRQALLDNENKNEFLQKNNFVNIAKSSNSNRGKVPDEIQKNSLYVAGKDLYKQIVTELREVFKKAEKEHYVDLFKIEKLAESIVDHLEKNNELLLQALYQKNENSIVNDSINTAIYAVLIGKGLNYSRGKLIQLAIVALLQDIGFVKLPEILKSPHKDLSPEEIYKIQMHPIYSSEIIKSSLSEDLLEQYAWLPNVVLQVHEREGGIGYPHGLKGEEINEIAKIVGLANTFEALLWEQTNKKVSITYQALQKIIQLNEKYFPQRLKKALVSQISIFPLGTYVKLNSGEIGMVVGTNASHPTRPIVEIMFDSQGVPLNKPFRKNLMESPFLYITEVIPPDEIYKKQQDKLIIV